MKEIEDNPPSFVRSDEALTYYYEILSKLVENDVPLKSQDSFGIGTMAINYAAIDNAQRDIDENGIMLGVKGSDRHMLAKANPAITILKDAQANVRFYLKEFQMSPQSRGKGFNLSGSGSSNKNDGFEEV